MEKVPVPLPGGFAYDIFIGRVPELRNELAALLTGSAVSVVISAESAVLTAGSVLEVISISSGCVSVCTGTSISVISVISVSVRCLSSVSGRLSCLSCFSCHILFCLSRLSCRSCGSFLLGRSGLRLGEIIIAVKL